MKNKISKFAFTAGLMVISSWAFQVTAAESKPLPEYAFQEALTQLNNMDNSTDNRMTLFETLLDNEDFRNGLSMKQWDALMRWHKSKLRDELVYGCCGVKRSTISVLQSAVVKTGLLSDSSLHQIIDPFALTRDSFDTLLPLWIDQHKDDLETMSDQDFNLVIKKARDVRSRNLVRFAQGDIDYGHNDYYGNMDTLQETLERAKQKRLQIKLEAARETTAYVLESLNESLQSITNRTFGTLFTFGCR